MPHSNAPALRSVVPILPVSNIDASIHYYESVLGFRVGWKWGTPASIASVCRDKVELMLELRSAAEPVAIGKVYVQMSGVEEYYTRITGAGAKVSYPLAARDYGMKDCRIIDPDGNELSFGEPSG